MEFTMTETCRGIGIDLDGVLFDQLGSIVRESKRQFGIEITREQITKYDLSAVTPLSKREVEILIHSKEFATGDPIEDAALATRILFDHFVIHIPTARSYCLWKETLDWLREKQVFYTFLRFISSKEKPEYARRFHLEYFVEDSLENAIAIAEFVPTVFLIDYLYNRGETPENVVRVSGWREILYHIARRDPIAVESIFRSNRFVQQA